MSGRPEVEQDEVRPAALPALERRAAVGASIGPVAARRQLADERRPRLVVVLDDEDRRSAGAGRRVGHADGLGRRRRGAPAAGRSRSIARPPSSLRRAPTRPPIASTRPRTTARPMPVPDREPPATPGHAVELVEEPRQRLVRHARARRPRSSAGRTARRPAARPTIRIGAPGGVYLIAFSSDVGHGLVEEDRVDLDRRRRRGRPRAAGRRAAARSRSSVRPTRSSSSKTSRSARSAPASIRLRSSRLVTSRLRYSTSRSIASALSCWSSALSPLPGRSVPAAARIVASGVRRSCETDCSRADLSASLWRAISAACDSAARRSWASAWPIWSAAAASSRVSVRSGSPVARVAERPDRAEAACAAGLDPDPVRLAARGRAPAPGPAGGRGSSARASRRASAGGPGASPGSAGRRLVARVGGDPLAGVVRRRARSRRAPSPSRAAGCRRSPAAPPASTRASRARG